MFVALRDLRFARGRFVLIGSVVALITVLVGFLSGLTGGLATIFFAQYIRAEKYPRVEDHSKTGLKTKNNRQLGALNIGEQNSQNNAAKQPVPAKDAKHHDGDRQVQHDHGQPEQFLVALIERLKRLREHAR